MKGAAWLLAFGLVVALSCDSEVDLSCARFDSDYEGCRGEGFSCHWLGNTPEEGQCMKRCDVQGSSCDEDERCVFTGVGYTPPGGTGETSNPTAYVCVGDDE